MCGDGGDAHVVSQISFLDNVSNIHHIVPSDKRHIFFCTCKGESGEKLLISFVSGSRNFGKCILVFRGGSFIEQIACH